MPVDYSQLQSCTYGTTAFQLASYSVREEPVVKEGIGRTSTRVRIELAGTLEGADPGDMNSKLAAAIVDLETDGRDLLIKGIAAALEYSLLAAQAYNGGPHVAFEITPGPTGLVKNVKGIITSEQMAAGSSAYNAYKNDVATAPDGLRTITRDGEVNGPNGLDYFINTVLPAFSKEFANGRWVTSYDYDTAQDQPSSPASPGSPPRITLKVTYKFTARELFGVLPIGDSTTFAIDGTASKRVDRDEQNRKTTVYEYDLSIAGDPVQILTVLRPTDKTTGVKGTVILRESVQIEALKNNHVRASFTTLTSGGSTALMNWQESMRMTYPGVTWEEKTYIGADPILVQRPRTIGRMVQSGTAIAAQLFKRQPPPAFTFQEREGEVTLTDLNAVEKQTTWNYQLFVTDAQGNPFTTDGVGKVNPWFLGRDTIDNNFYPTDPSLPNAPAAPSGG